MNTINEKKEVVLQMFFNLNEYVSDISFFLERIDIMTDDISSNLYVKSNFDPEKNRMVLEETLRIVRIKADILSEYTSQAMKIIPKLLETADYVYQNKRKEIKPDEDDSCCMSEKCNL